MSTATPTAITTPPATPHLRDGQALPMRQPGRSHQGTSRGTRTPGAITEKTAVPAAAAIFRIGSHPARVNLVCHRRDGSPGAPGAAE